MEKFAVALNMNNSVAPALRIVLANSKEEALGIVFIQHNIDMEYVEGYSVVPCSADDTIDREIVEALLSGRKILAIKRYRTITGAGLKDAKDTIEKWIKEGRVTYNC